MADIDYVHMADASNKALQISDKQVETYCRCADMVGADVRAYTGSTKHTETFGYDMPVMVFGDDKGDFLKEITREQKRAHSEGLSVPEYMMCWKTLLSTSKPPKVWIVFEPSDAGNPQEIVFEIGHFQEWVVVHNLLFQAYRFLGDGCWARGVRNQYLKDDVIPNNGIAFFLSDHNRPLLRAFVAQNIREHLGKGVQYWTEL